MAQEVIKGVKVEVGQVWTYDHHTYVVAKLAPNESYHYSWGADKTAKNSRGMVQTDFRACTPPVVVASAPPPAPVVVLPSVDSLARALFETDERVIADVHARGHEGRPTGSRLDETSSYFQRAWDKNIKGWRADAIRRAETVLRLMGGK